jgi:LacI family transcriptional regulator
MAQRLRDRKTRNIAVIVPDIQDALYSTVIDGMEEVIYRKGYNLIVHKTAESYHREQLLIQTLASHVDGVVMALSADTKKFDHLKELKHKNIPLVLFDRYSNKINCSKVVFNDEKTSFAITEQLIKSGCKNIAFITGPLSLTTFELRAKGYTEALKKNGITVDLKMIISTKLSKQEGKQAFHSLMHVSKKIDGIITDNSSILLSVHSELRRVFSEGHAISLASLDYNELYSYLQPPVTCVLQKGYEMGSFAAQTCIQEIESNEKVKASTHIISSQLIVRTPKDNEGSNELSNITPPAYSAEEIIYVY